MVFRRTVMIMGGFVALALAAGGCGEKQGEDGVSKTGKPSKETSGTAETAHPSRPVAPTPPPEEHSVTLKCVADTHLAAYPSEQTDAYGGTNSLKIKHRENFPLMKFDASVVPPGATVKKASLFVHVNDPDPGFFLNHVSVSTVPTDWVEGDGKASGKHDWACLLWPGPRTRKWGWKLDRDIFGSIFGNGGNVTSLAVAEDKGGQWWEIPLEPRVVDALRKDQPGGIILHDEMIKRTGKYANIYLDSRENAGGKFAPRIELVYTVEDKTPPSAPRVLSVRPGPYPGSVVMKIRCGGDDGDEGTALGFDISCVGTGEGGAPKPVERYMIPRPVAAGGVVTALLEGLEPGKEYSFRVKAYDEAGNYSEKAVSPVVASCPAEAKPLAGFKPIEVRKGGPLEVGPVKVFAVDGLTKVDPVSGKVLGGPQDARDGNHVFDGASKRVRLFGARGELLSFNLVLEAEEPVEVAVRPVASAEGPDLPLSAFKLYRVIYAKERFGEAAPPDPGPFRIPSRDPEVKGQKNQMVAVDVYIPGDLAPGDYSAALEISAGDASAELPVDVRVYPVRLPDRLSFLVELNTYGCRDKDYFYAVHRLAHYNRLGYNVLSYTHSGNTTLPVVPRVEGTGKDARVADWSPWDDWMGPLLDGSLFDDMPRKGVPIPHFYLPFYENWPVPLRGHYTNKELADRPPRPRKADQKAAYEKWCMDFARKAPLMEDALDAEWVEGNRAVSRQFREHFEEKGWFGTEFQFFLNNKYYKGDLSYWTLDEPSAGHDFRALAYIYKVQSGPWVGSNLDFVNRGDVSRPEIMGDRMDGVPNLLLNMSGGYHQYSPLCRRMILTKGFRTWLYGGGRGVEADNTGLDALIVKSWLMGTVGCMPYWTSFGGDNSWTGGSTLRQVFDGRRHGYRHRVIGSLRLFAMRRGQEDCELLNLLASKPGWDRWSLARTVLSYLNLGGTLKSRGADDPGRVSFSGITPAALAALRRALLEELSR